MVCAKVFRFLLLGARTALKAYFAQIKTTCKYSFKIRSDSENWCSKKTKQKVNFNLR